MVNHNVTAQSVGGATDIVAVIFIGILAVSVLIATIFIIKIFYNRYVRNSVRFNIIMPDGKIRKQRLKNVDKRVTVFSQNYVFDEKALINFRNTREIFYFYKHPKPILFDRKKINPNSISSTDMNNILNEEYSAKLFKTSGLDTKDFILIGAIIIVGVISLYTAYQLNQGISLSSEQVEVISNSVLNAIRGGA